MPEQARGHRSGSGERDGKYGDGMVYHHPSAAMGHRHDVCIKYAEVNFDSSANLSQFQVVNDL